MELEPELAAQLKRVLSSSRRCSRAPCRDRLVGVRRRELAEALLLGFLEPIGSVEDLRLEDLLGIEEQNGWLKRTPAIPRRPPANNILLWGSRAPEIVARAGAPFRIRPGGCGSSRWTRTTSFTFPPSWTNEGAPHKFILFSDDLSFETGSRATRC